MKETPILFKPWKVRKILEWDWSAGNMQTRRVIEPQPPRWKWNRYKFDDQCVNVAFDAENEYWVICRYGKPNDLLWVKETWTRGDNGYLYKATHPKDEPHPRWKSSLYMPKDAARIWLRVVDVRAEQLQDIAPEDVLKEGIVQTKDEYWLAPLAGTPDFPWGRAELAFASVWGEINDKDGHNWNSNPWVWVVTYTLHQRSPT